MRVRGWMLALAGLGAASAVAAQDLKSPSADQYVPRLGDIMSAAQTRHHKLWMAGKAQNWELAAYELRQLKANLVEAAVFYSGIPVGNVTTLEPSLQSMSDAIDAKDSRKFAKGLGELTEGCNACHRSLKRSFVVIKVPSDEKPFANQQFAPTTRP
ncbi:hypothetical protein [Bradyrhizobium sp. WSM471]|uniref:hypothetical protein n=1 Tax=Bradyrhizobium sp. WSM471 TaxID=319017 RepID=UPI00024D2961|nr:MULTISPECIES: hypothetical protein [Bradyrhizobium]EHR02940.1 hypothetical protein Bra471DRAFT_03704 [Bradyrhizobium sp. WSM471]UFW38185.1 hypothetical protein BcanWSM471_18180 [Bradyrhizobium canariense]